jgi:hypothetical protein
VPLAAAPTPDDGKRLSGEQPWDEASRPTAPVPDPERLYTPAEQASAQRLLDVHGQLRDELVRLRGLMTQVGRGLNESGGCTVVFNRMMIRQNTWTLGAFCESYCRAVSTHHTLEDRRLFPHLQAAHASLSEVLDRLAHEHEVTADIVERIDTALIALVAAEPDGMTRSPTPLIC